MKECCACGWDGSLHRASCPGCGASRWYCSDCDVRTGSESPSHRFNCGECQKPVEARRVAESEAWGGDLTLSGQHILK